MAGSERNIGRFTANTGKSGGKTVFDKADVAGLAGLP
jgi:hypothetical protein